MSAKDGGPAFPRDERHVGHNGMTLRDYFAAKAMHALMVGNFPNADTGVSYAQGAYEIADAMLKAREVRND